MNDIRVHRAKRRSSATAPACLSAHKPPVGDKRKACADDISGRCFVKSCCMSDLVAKPLGKRLAGAHAALHTAVTAPSAARQFILEKAAVAHVVMT